MKITISYQQEAPGGAVFRGTLYNPYPLPVTGAISLTNEIHMTVSDGFEAIAVLSGQYLGRAINVVLQDLTDQGVTGAFSLKLGEQQIEDDGQDDVQDQPEQKPGPEEEEDRPAESAPAQQPAPAPQR